MQKWWTGGSSPPALPSSTHLCSAAANLAEDVSRGNKKCWVVSKFLKSSVCICIYIISYHIILYYIRLYIMYYILYIVYCILYIVYYILYIIYYTTLYHIITYVYILWNIIYIYIYNTTYIIYSATIINCIYNYSTLYGYRERERGRCLDVDRTEVGSHLCIFPRRSSYKGS